MSILPRRWHREGGETLSRKTWILAMVAVTASLCIVFWLLYASSEGYQYDKAVEAFRAFEYEEATNILSSLSSKYRDSQLMKDCQDRIEEISISEKRALELQREEERRQEARGAKYKAIYNEAVLAYLSGDDWKARKILAAIPLDNSSHDVPFDVWLKRCQLEADCQYRLFLKGEL
jgi:predicted Zn-dependent protease